MLNIGFCLCSFNLMLFFVCVFITLGNLIFFLFLLMFNRGYICAIVVLVVVNIFFFPENNILIGLNFWNIGLQLLTPLKVFSLSDGQYF